MGFIAALEQADLKSAAALLLNRWEQNRRFFQVHLPDLAALFETPTQTYELSLGEAGVNLRHKQTLQPLYPIGADGKSTLFAAGRALAFDPPRNPRWKLQNAQGGLRREDENAFEITARGLNALADLLESDSEFQPGTLHYDGTRQLPPLVSYGLLSGVHLALLQEAGLLENGVIVFEPEPDFFVLSAYFVDYAELMRPERENLLIVKGHPDPLWIRRFFSQRVIVRGFIRLECALYDHPAFADAAVRVDEAVKETLRGWGTAEDELYGLRNKLTNLKNPQAKLLCQNAAVAAPIAVVGNGPSLDRLLPFLKQNREGMLIFSAGTALKPLRSAGIVPDFQIEIERRDHVAGVLEAAPLGEVTLLGADLLHPTTLAAAREVLLFIRDQSASEALWQPQKVVRFSNPLVGNAATSLALEFSREVYLCGLDVAFRKDQKQHATRSHYDTLKDSGGEQFPVRGNLSRDLWTNSLFSLSRSVLEKAIAAAPQARVFNLSDGAFIQGATPAQAGSIHLPPVDRQAAAAQIRSCFVEGGCFGDRTSDPYGQLKILREKLNAVLTAFSPRNKQELALAVNAAYKASVLLRREYPLAGTLVSGTFWHLLNALYKGLLQVGRSDIAALYQSGARLILQTLDRISASLSGEPPESPPEKPRR